MKQLWRQFWVLLGVAGVLVSLIIPMPRAAANPYGKGGYGTCVYAVCTPTQVVLPSGLKVSINLADGQIIPRKGWTVTITPLNGQGSSFQYADILIDGQPVNHATPDETGTASWFWDPVAHPGSIVTVIVTDTDGAATTHTFHITIADITPVPAGSTTPGNTSGRSNTSVHTTGIAALLDFAGTSLNSLSNGAVRTIKALPKPLAYSFPYILFGLLAAQTLLLLFQMQREVREYHVLRSLLAREQAIAESKKVFMELVSHYLRTPITIVLGGIDMLQKDPAAKTAASTIQRVAQSIGTKIESLISDTRTASEIALAQRGDTALSATALWRQPGLFAPVLLILIILVPYNYLAQHGGALSITQVNVAVQVITFLGLVSILYLVFRQLRLQRRDQHELQRLSETQAASSRIRDDLITSTTTTLRTDIGTIDILASQFRDSQAVKFINDGQQRFHDVLTKCTIAASLRGSRSTSLPVTTALDSLLQAAEQSLALKLGGRALQTGQTNESFTTQNPELVSYVLHTVLDNAATYSAPEKTIDVQVQADKSGTDIIITDHGEGMPTAKVSQLFQPFFKAEGAEKFNHEGMGFSLYLDKLIMEYLGGTISLVSQKGHGTTVTLHLPA